MEFIPPLKFVVLRTSTALRFPNQPVFPSGSRASRSPSFDIRAKVPIDTHANQISANPAQLTSCWTHFYVARSNDQCRFHVDWLNFANEESCQIQLSSSDLAKCQWSISMKWSLARTSRIGCVTTRMHNSALFCFTEKQVWGIVSRCV